MSRRVIPFLSAIAVAFGACVSAAHAYPQGYVDAQMDQQLKPNFGILLHPPLYRHHRLHGVWYGRRRGWGSGYSEPYGQPYGAPYGPMPPYMAGGTSITVDCGDPAYGPTPISDAAEYVPDGGVVYVRAHGQACRETIEIDHPVVIAAEDASAFSTDPGRARVVISPPDGQPCVLIAQGVRQVELRGLQLTSSQGAQSSCIEAWDSEIALVRDDIDYSGDASAVYVSGGRLIIRESRIDAHTYDAAIFDDGAELQMNKVKVRADTIGVDLTLGPAESLIEQVGILTAHSAGPGEVGVSIKGERTGGALLRIRNDVICGFRVGVGLERGGRADIRRTRICDSSYGVMGQGADADIEENAIGADRFGVYLASGTAEVDHNRIYDLPAPIGGIFAEPAAAIKQGTNWLYLRPGCDHFHWDGRLFCRDMTELPFFIRDESSFDTDYVDAWAVDGYESGYMRDGPVVAFDPRDEQRQRRRGGFGGGARGGGGFGGGARGGGFGGGAPGGGGPPGGGFGGPPS